MVAPGFFFVLLKGRTCLPLWGRRCPLGTRTPLVPPRARLTLVRRFILCFLEAGFASPYGGRYVPVARCLAAGLRFRDRRSWTVPTGHQDPNREVRRCRRRRRRELLREQILLPGEVSRQWRDGRGFGGRVDESCKKRGFALAKWEFCKLPSGSCRVSCTKCNLTRAHPPCPLPRTNSLRRGRCAGAGGGFYFSYIKFFKEGYRPL